MIDLHLSCLEDPSLENIKMIVAFSKFPILALNYNGKYDWSDAGYATEEDRVDLLLRAVESVENLKNHGIRKTAPFLGAVLSVLCADNLKCCLCAVCGIPQDCRKNAA